MRRGLELKWPELSSQIQSKSMHPLSKVQPAPLQHQNWTGGGAGPGAARGHWGATPRGLCILCAPKGARTARAQHKALRLLHFRVLSAPHAPACGFPPSPPSPRAAGVGWSPQGCLRSKESVLPISGEVLSSQGQDANSEWQQRGEASPGSLPSLGKPLECEKRHLSCQGGQECKQLLCVQPTLLALSSPLAMQEQWPSIQQSPHALNCQPGFPRHTGPQAGHLKEAAWILPMLWGVWKCCASFQKSAVQLYSSRGKEWNWDQERRAHVWTPIHLFLMLSGKRHNKTIAELGIECQVPLSIIIKTPHY